MSQHSFIDIRKVCALGAGTMGVGTAVDYAKEGYAVALYIRGQGEEGAAKQEKALHGIKTVLGDMAQHGLIDPESIDGIMARITITNDLHQAARDADLVMESIKEDVGAKQKIFLELDKICPPHTIFATNTSALNPSEIASVLSETRQQQFIVMHGFNPPHLMPLIEIVPGDKTSLATINNAAHILALIGKKPVRLHKATPGFIGNYIQSAIIWTALKLHVEYKMEPAKIDAEFKEKLGQYYEVLGPLEMAKFENGDLSHAEANAALIVHKQEWPRTTIAERIQHAAVGAALEIVASGTASAKEVEYAFIQSLGRRYKETGPLESADMGGLDIFQSIFRTLGYLDHESAVGGWLAQQIERGETGVKSDSKKGVYKWTPEMIAEVSGRRKAKLVKFLHKDNAHRSSGRPANQTVHAKPIIG